MNHFLILLSVFLFLNLFLGCCEIFKPKETGDKTEEQNQTEDITINTSIVEPVENATNITNDTSELNITYEINKTIYNSKWNEEIIVSPKYSPGKWIEAHKNCSEKEEIYKYIICIGDYAADHLDVTICLNLPTEQYIEQCIMKAGARLPSPTYCNQLDPQYIDVENDRWKRKCWRAAKHHFE